MTEYIRSFGWLRRCGRVPAGTLLISVLALLGLLACGTQQSPVTETAPATSAKASPATSASEVADPQQATGTATFTAPAVSVEESGAADILSPAPSPHSAGPGLPVVSPDSVPTISGSLTRPALPTLAAEPSPTPALTPAPTPGPTLAPVELPTPPATPTPPLVAWALPYATPEAAATHAPAAVSTPEAAARPDNPPYKDSCDFTDAVSLTSQEGEETATAAESGPENDVLWRFSEADNQGTLRQSGSIENHPIIEDGIIYFGAAATGCLYAIDASTGKTLWVHRGGDKIRTAPAAADGVVYVAPMRNSYRERTQVHALDSKTGQLLWDFGEAGAGATSPVAIEGVVVFGANDSPDRGNRVMALDAHTGYRRWAHTTADRIFGVATSPGKVYATTWSGQLLALDSSSGKLRWQRQLETPSDPYPTIYEGTLLVGSGRNGFMALDPNTGATLWERDLEGVVSSQPLAHDGKIYVATSPWYLNALDIATGEIYWRMPYERGELAPPAMADGRLILGTEEGQIITIDAETGRVLKVRSVDAPIYTRPAITENAIIFTNLNDLVMAINLPAMPADGAAPTPDTEPEQIYENLLWATYTGGPLFASPRVGSDKLLLVTPSDAAVSSERIVAVNKNNGEILWSARDGGKWLMSWIPPVEEAVFLPSSRERMAARDIETGDLLWEYFAGSAVPAFPLVGDNTVLFKSEDNILHAIDRFTGGLRWKLDARVSRAVWPNGSDGLVYFGAIGIYALDEQTGEERWQKHTRSGLRGFPFLSGDYLCFQTEKNSVAALDRWTGEKAWEQMLDGQSLSLTVTDGVAYSATWGKNVYAVEVDSGTLLWRAELDTLLTSGPRVTAAGGVVIAGTDSNGYTVFDAATGHELWKNDIQEKRKPPPWPAVSEGVAFIGPHQGELFARDLRTGEVRAKYDTADISYLLVISERVAYLHANDGYTYALDVSDSFDR
ncbi:MAG: PQQ-binding-like beta-propeller repeat protein [Chloroflexi bacterium]|nr:PQQ-binding-like beta-propeller repeat protein [Chloroflexota bacterium]